MKERLRQASNDFSAQDAGWMAQALALAQQGRYSSHPNPRVGAVLVQQGQVVGQGYHLQAGQPHAEIHALQQAGTKAAGATLYVTLEPCSHFGRTPPCADAVIAAGVARVVVAMIDPNPLVAGQGIARLHAAGIEVSCGLLATEAERLNQGFISRMTRNRPWVRLKYGMSLDGHTALANGQSQWITGEDARRDVQLQRAASSAILTGIGTVLADDPRLSVRADELPHTVELLRQPWRVVVDSHNRLPADARLFSGASRVIQAGLLPETTQHRAEYWSLPSHEGRVNLVALVARLAQAGCNDLWVEAGAELGGSLIQLGLVDELWLYTAPMLLGQDSRALVSLAPLTHLAQAKRWHFADTRLLGQDLRLILTPSPESNDP